MQDHSKNSHARRTWYQKAIEMAAPKLWKTIPKSRQIPPPTTNPTLWSTISRSNEVRAPNSTQSDHKRLRKCTSLKIATSFTRVCLCAPISSYSEIFRSDIPPRRSYSYPRSKHLPVNLQPEKSVSGVARLSAEGRRVFRGKSLTDDVLMRRFVVEEEAMMQVRKRNQMEVIRRRSLARRKRIGPSRLSRMITAEEINVDFEPN